MTRIDDSELRSQLKAAIQQDPTGGSLQLMDLILKLFNLHPETQPESFINLAWMEKSQGLLVALDYFFSLYDSSTNLRKKVQELSQKVDQSARELMDSRTQLENLQNELENNFQQKIQIVQTLEQLKAIDAIFSAQPKVKELWLKFDDDERHILVRRQKEVATLLENAKRDIANAEEVIREMVTKFEEEVAGLQKENGR